MDDNALLSRAVDGDEAAFELLVRRHTDALWRLARSLLPDDGSAEEAVQDAFWKAYRGLSAFRGDSSVSTWLVAICHRCCLDRLRLRRAHVVSLDAVRRAREDDTVLRLALEEAVGALPPDDRAAFTLVCILGYTREEAASIAAVPASTMRSRVSRARERLARALAEPSLAFGEGGL